MNTLLIQRLRSLVPLPQVLVGEVIEIHTEDDTSTVRIPGPSTLTEYASNVATGSLVRVRGTGVAVGSRAFIRAGVVESQAPDGEIIRIEVGRVVVL